MLILRRIYNSEACNTYEFYKFCGSVLDQHVCTAFMTVFP